MCGIAGFVDFGSKEILKKSSDLLAHRGPDDEGLIWYDEHNSGLAHKRLSIIDLSTAGHQPMSTENGRYHITYNGEVFNFREIRDELAAKGYRFKSDCDTEVVLYAYAEWKEKCTDKFIGMFAFAVYDSLDNSLFAVRDRLGIKPFYYSARGNSLVFASEIKSVIASGIAEAVPDKYVLTSPIHYSSSPLTGFENIYKLPAGQYLNFKNGKLNVAKYWDIYPTENNEIKVKDAADKLDELLNSAVKYQMVSDVPVGLFLSGGLDSSVIAALMRKYNNGDINAFTIKFPHEDQNFEKIEDDSIWAKMVADLFEFNYEEMVIKPDVRELLEKTVYHQDEPLADPAVINTYLISKFARQNDIYVLLSGMGGDEVFGGYRKHLACLLGGYYRDFIPPFLRRYAEESINSLQVASERQGFKYARWAKRFTSFASREPYMRFLLSDVGVNEKLYGELFSDNGAYEDSYYYKSQEEFFFDNAKDVHYLNKMCLCDTKAFLAGHNLNYSDKASMMASAEIRPPLIDHRIAEFMFTLPPSFRIRGLTQKYLLKKVAERYLPKAVVHRPKAPFGSPLRSWVRRQLADTVDSVLTEENVRKRGIYNYDAVRRLIYNDRAGLEDNAHLVWRLLTVETWFRVFFD